MENDEINNEKPLKSLEIKMKRDKGLSCFTLTLTFTSAIGGFLFGYNTGVVSGALIMMDDPMPMTDLQKQIFVSFTMLAALVFSLVSGFLNDSIGRKKTMMLAAMIFAIGGVVLAAAQSVWTLFIGRIIIGIALGISSMSTSMYIAECSPRSHRGLLVTVNTVFVTGAQFISCLVCGLVSFYPVHGWRIALGLGSIPALIQLIMFTCLPESPRWLVCRGRESAARQILKKIEEDDDVVDEEINAINDCLHRNEESKGFSTLGKVLRTRHVLKALFVGVVLQAVQQFGGINAVMYYSATIIQMSGVESLSNAIWLSALVASINFLATFISFPMVDRVGRRTLTLLSLFGAFLGLLVLGVGFKLASIKSPPVSLSLGNESSCLAYSTCETCVADPTCNYCYQPDDASFSNTFCYPTNLYNNQNGALSGAYNNTNTQTSDSFNDNSQCSAIFKQTFLKSSKNNVVDNSGLNNKLVHKGWKESFKYCNTPFYWLSTFGMIVFLIFFAPGMGPMPWTINSEIYPNWARSTCVSIATCVNWLCNMIVSFTFLSLINSIGGYGAFFLFAGVVFFSFILLILILPETKNKSLEEIEDLFRGRLIVKRNNIKV